MKEEEADDEKNHQSHCGHGCSISATSVYHITADIINTYTLLATCPYNDLVRAAKLSIT